MGVRSVASALLGACALARVAEVPLRAATLDVHAIAADVEPVEY